MFCYNARHFENAYDLEFAVQAFEDVRFFLSSFRQEP